jgi:hypothetical protein
MSSAIITALLILMMLLIAASLTISTWLAHRHHTRMLVAQARSAAHPPGGYVTTILRGQEGVIVGIEKPQCSCYVPLSASWYTRRRMLVSLGLLGMVLLALCVQGGLAGGTLRDLSKGIGLTLLNNVQGTDVQPAAHPIPSTPSSRLVRLDSAARNQYHSNYEWQVWSYSSCSGMAMAMVMNAYGSHLIGADVLEEEQKLGVWNVQLGLLREDGIALTAAYFGFNASLSHARTLQDVINTSNEGEPVIVSVRDSYYFPGGHILVVRGGDNQDVYLADSSPANFQSMNRSMFQGMWTGFSAILTPKDA